MQLCTIRLLNANEIFQLEGCSITMAECKQWLCLNYFIQNVFRNCMGGGLVCFSPEWLFSPSLTMMPYHKCKMCVLGGWFKHDSISSTFSLSLIMFLYQFCVCCTFASVKDYNYSVLLPPLNSGDSWYWYFSIPNWSNFVQCYKTVSAYIKVWYFWAISG